MKIAMFYHSLVSDWNHGNAHFLRGIVTELGALGYRVEVFEPQDSWSFKNLVAEHGQQQVERFHAAYPGLKSHRYDPKALDLDGWLDSTDLVIVHEWNDPALVKAIGRHHERNRGYHLLFHDTHHRLVSAPGEMSELELENYDGVLAYGAALKDLYEASRRVARVWTWHEAADIRVFRPLPNHEPKGDLVWIGNWGDGERTAELMEFLIRPARALSLNARVHGVRYPNDAKALLASAGIHYAGWLPNFEVPRVFASYKVTMHVPRRPYVRALPGIPTIRPFEALACGIPLVCSPWRDIEGLFTPGLDFLFAKDGKEMTSHLKCLLADETLRKELSEHGLATIRSRHTCAHRVRELLAIHAELRGENMDRECVTMSAMSS